MSVAAVAMIILVPGLAVLAFVLLGTVWTREQIKRDLADRGLILIKVRWKPFAWWTVGQSSGYVVTYADALGTQHTSRCWVWDRKVNWVPDDDRYLDPDQGWVSRAVYLSMALALLYFSVRWLIHGDLTWRSRMHTLTHIRGIDLTLLCSSMFAAASSILIQGLYFGRQARAERVWTIASRTLTFLAFVLFAASIVAGIVTQLRS